MIWGTPNYSWKHLLWKVEHFEVLARAIVKKIIMDTAYNECWKHSKTPHFLAIPNMYLRKPRVKSQKGVFFKKHSWQQMIGNVGSTSHGEMNKPKMEPHTRGSTKLWFCTLKIWKRVRLYWLVINYNTLLLESSCQILWATVTRMTSYFLYTPKNNM